MKWCRDSARTPAWIYKSTDGRYEIIWDPEGWHLWDDRELMGVSPTLRAAKESAEERGA